MALQDSFTYDVYLSFRGEDTRYGFTGHLIDALNRRGIRTFIDDAMRIQGEEIFPSLLKAIEESRIAIIIFSKNYASSSWCLDKLTKILDYYEDRKTGRLVLPVYYGVDPSDLRHGRRSYGEAFVKHEQRFNNDKERVNKWRNSLRKAAGLAGFCYRMDGYEDEYNFIKTIVEEVDRKISCVCLPVADYPVGLESRVYKVISLLNLESHDVVLMVGIHGIGGIGKTTIARAVYNSIGDQFEGLCFLEDVRVSSMEYGLEHLQETMLYNIYGNGDINIKNAKEGISMMRVRLYQKKVLLVLDDVDKMEQLQATIAGASDWFAPGSRVIITTRDKHLLASHAVERTYEVEELNEKEALDLFCWNVFKTDKVDPSYADISKQVLTFASGNPFALRVVGSYLFGRSIYEWRSALDKYERIPIKKIQTILKISYDSLEEEEKRIFLDIACFFNGDKLESVKNILSALYGASVKYSIEELIEKSLIKIDDGFVTLHNLIQDMGREIVRQESPLEPGKRSRLWHPEDVLHVLKTNSGSSTIESLFLDFPKDEVNPNGSKSKEVYWDGDALKKMQKLRVLVIRSGCFNKGPTHLPNSLKVLKWRGYPSSSLPNDFHPKELAILKLPASCMAVTLPIQRFISLKVLNFSNCELVTRIPDVSGLPNLEKLSFRDCMNLSKIHESVGFLDKLTILDVCHCKKLMILPPIILTSLEQLNLSHCSALESFPEILGKMENLTELRIIGSPIKHLPFSIQNLNGLQKLELQNCGMLQLPSSIAMFSQLYLMCVSRCEGLWLTNQDVGEEWETRSSKTEHLMLSYCNLSDDFLPKGVTWFPNVKDLDLSGSNFTILHACIKECYSLRNLKLDDCMLIREIKVLPWKLETFSAKRCKSLKYMDITEECRSLRELILDDCIYLREIKGILPNLDHFSAKNCTLLTSQCASMLVNQEMIEAGNKMFFLPGTKIPDWFSHRTSGESISFWYCNKFPAISLCLVIGLVDKQPISVKFSPKVFINGNEQSSGNPIVYEFRVAMDHILLLDARLLKFEDNEDTVFSDKEWNHVIVSYEDLITDNGVPIRGVSKYYSGIHVFNQTSGLGDIQFTDPQKTWVNANLDPNSMLGPPQRGKIMTKRSQEVQTMALSHKLTSTQSASPPSEAEKGLVSQIMDMSNDSESLSDNEVYANNDQVSLNDDAFMKVNSNPEEQFSMDDEITVSKSKPSLSIPSPIACQFPSKGDPSQKIEDLRSSLLVKRELEELISKNYLDYESLSLLTDFLVKNPSVRLKDTSLSYRYKGYAYMLLAELLKFLKTHSLLEVSGSSHSEFMELLQDARRIAFDKEWLDSVERRALFPEIQVSQDALEKLLDSKKRITKDVEDLRLKMQILSQHAEDVKRQLTSAEESLERIIQQEAVLSAPIEY